MKPCSRRLEEPSMNAHWIFCHIAKQPCSSSLPILDLFVSSITTLHVASRRIAHIRHLFNLHSPNESNEQKKYHWENAHPLETPVPLHDIVTGHWDSRCGCHIDDANSKKYRCPIRIINCISIDYVSTELLFCNLRICKFEDCVQQGSCTDTCCSSR